MIKMYFEDVSAKTTKKLHKSLVMMIEQRIKDQADLDGELECFFPEIVYAKNRKKCRRILAELVWWARDTKKHDLPFWHRYALYAILQASADIYEDEKEMQPELFPEMPEFEDEDEMDKFLSSEENLILLDPEIFLEECFYDHDFLMIEDLIRVRLAGATLDEESEREIISALNEMGIGLEDALQLS